MCDLGNPNLPRNDSVLTIFSTTHFSSQENIFSWYESKKNIYDPTYLIFFKAKKKILWLGQRS